MLPAKAGVFVADGKLGLCLEPNNFVYILQTSLTTMERRRRLRLAYQELYASARAHLPSFQEPNLRWWQKKRVSAAGRAELDELSHMEAGMKLEEIVHFRCDPARGYWTRPS